MLFALLAACFSFAACSKKEDTTDDAAVIASWQEKYTAGSFGIRSKKDPFVEFTFNTGDTIRVELYKSVAPITVNNFITYVEEGFYEGVTFHRIKQGQMIQTGGFVIEDNVFVQKEPTHPAIKGEFKINGVNNTLSHTSGVISMARTDLSFDSATSQFFICSATVTGWDGSYAAFGRVIDEESMAVVSRLEKLETHSERLYYGAEYSTPSDVPVTRVTINKAKLVWDK